MKDQLVCVMVALSLATGVRCAVASAETLSFDFASGLGPYFYKQGDLPLLEVDTIGAIRIHKPADDRTYRGDQTLSSGIQSYFQVTGNFTATVDYTLINFPTPTDYGGNTIQFTVYGDNSSLYSIWHFMNFDDTVPHVTHVDPAHSWGSGPTNAATSGQYRFTREEGTMTMSYRPAGSTDFIMLESVPTGNDPAYLQMSAAGVRTGSAYLRPTTPLDVSFDNLVITADGFIGAVPAPVPLPAPVWTGLLGLCFVAGWRHRRAWLLRRHDAEHSAA